MWVREYGSSIWHWYEDGRLDRTMCDLENTEPIRISEISEGIPIGRCLDCEKLRNRSIKEKGEQTMNEKKRPEFVIRESVVCTEFDLVDNVDNILWRASNSEVGGGYRYTFLELSKKTGEIIFVKDLPAGLGLRLDTEGRIMISGFTAF